ncbi:MAG: NUDIX hydrolase [Acidimicrobiia bacterium]|nr:NUDIX hydrolase [Acidimicrobiia bacterium]MBV9285774.1 NUDIX hydrolase [Acidimicrobiia bacterium]
MKDAVLAAGGVLWRRKKSGKIEVLLVHRPKYDDWTLPKGKLDEGETAQEAAVREVEEETGFLVKLVEELPSTDYHDRYGRPKHVRYWVMDITDGEFRPNREVDEVRWLSVGEAKALLSYSRDRDVLEAFAARS